MKHWRQAVHSRFLRNTGALGLASVIAQLLAVANLVLVARMYAQTDVGVFGVFLSYSALLTTAHLLSYELAIPNVAKEQVPALLQGLALILAIGVLLVCAAFLFAGYEHAWALGCQTAAIGMSRTAEMLNIRHGRFTLIALARVIPHGSFTLLLLASSFTGALTIGTAIGAHAAIFLLVGLFYMAVSVPPAVRHRAHWSDVKRLLADKRTNAFLVAPSEVLNSAAYNLPVILIEQYFGSAAAGQYSIVLRLCFGPLNIISATIGKVYHSELAAAVRSADASSYARFRMIRRHLTYLGAALFVCIVLAFPPLIELLLGKGWEQAGTFAQILSPLFAVMVMVSPLTVCFYVLELHGYLLLNQSAYLFISLASFGLGILLQSLELGVVLFSLLSVMRYLLILGKVNTAMQQPLQPKAA